MCYKKNKDSEFLTQWDVGNIPTTINVTWLKQHHKNMDDHRHKQQEATTNYEENGTVTGNKQKRRRRNHGSTSSGCARERINNTATPVGNSITIAATEAAASICTSSSMVSSLTRNLTTASVLTLPSSTCGRGGRRVTTLDSQRNMRSTCSTHTIDSDSDDGGDLDEDDQRMDNVCTEDDSQETQAETEEDVDGIAGSTIFEQLKAPVWNFEVVPENTAIDKTEGPMWCNGPIGLKHGVADSFHDPLECLAANGLSRAFVARLAQSSNEHTRRHVLDKDRNSRLHGMAWRNVTVSEMHCFLGITLRISLSPFVRWWRTPCALSKAQRQGLW